MPRQFEFFVRLSWHEEVRVLVRGRTVELVSPRKGFLHSGLWDNGGYVRYQHAYEVPVHPAVLDEIDAELRVRLGKHARSRRRARPAIVDVPPKNLRDKAPTE